MNNHRHQNKVQHAPERRVRGLVWALIVAVVAVFVAAVIVFRPVKPAEVITTSQPPAAAEVQQPAQVEPVPVSQQPKTNNNNGMMKVQFTDITVKK